MSLADTIPPGRWQKVRGLFYRRVPECCMTPRWMGLAYRDMERMDCVMVAWPLNYAVRTWWWLGWWLGWRWDRFRHRRSWIDDMVKQARAEGRLDAHRETQRALDSLLR